MYIEIFLCDIFHLLAFHVYQHQPILTSVLTSSARSIHIAVIVRCIQTAATTRWEIVLYELGGTLQAGHAGGKRIVLGALFTRKMIVTLISKHQLTPLKKILGRI